MGTGSNISLLFQEIKPLTVAIARSPQVKDIKLLCQKLKQMDVDTLQKMQQYCMFPLGMLLKRKADLTETVLLSGFECMNCILERTSVHEEPMFRDLFTSMCLVISQPDGSPSKVSEEILLAATRCLTLLVEHTLLLNPHGIYEVDFMPACGHGVSLLLSLAEKHRSRDVQTAAMRALMVLTSTEETDVERRRHVGRYVASFLPGISMTLTRIVTGDVKQGHQVIELGLRCWSEIVSLVLDDRCVPCEKERLIDARDKPDLARLLVARTGDWLKASVEKLEVLISKHNSLTSHQHWAVRLALVQYCQTLLHTCWNSLARCRPHLLDVCLTLINDSYHDVTVRCSDVINDVRRRDGAGVVTLLEEHVYDICTSLPRLIRMQAEDDNVASLRKLLGYFRLLGEDLSPVMKCSVHVRRVYESLLQITEVDVSGIRIIEDRNILCSATSILTDDMMTSLPAKPRPNFRFLYDESVYELVVEICHALASYGDLDLLLDLCMESIQSSSMSRKEAMFLANQFILGANSNKTNPEMEDVVRLLVSVYLQPELLDLNIDDDAHIVSRDPVKPRNRLTVAKQTTFQSKSLRQLNSDIQQICLILSGLAECAKVLGPRFQTHLIEVLYPVLVCLASSNHVVSQTAHLALVDLAHSCEYRSLNELVCENADYLVNSISLRMRHFTDEQKAPLVLQVMTDICEDPQLLVYVRDVIEEVVLSLDEHYADHASRFLHVLRSLVKAVYRWHVLPHHGDKKPSDLSQPNPNSDTKSDSDTNQRLLSFLRQYGRQRKIAESLEVDEDGTTGDEDGTNGNEDGTTGDEVGPDDDDSATKKIPLHITVVRNILERCVHLMSHGDPRLRLLVLDITACGLRCLSGHTDELLPVSHLIWSPLTHRFRDHEQLVIVKSFELLCVMADVCEDFLTQRVRKHVIPQLSQFLHSQAPISMNSSMIYRQTVSYKTQLAILRQLGPLAGKLKLSDRHVDLLYQACKPYLSSRQPKPLQQVSTECIAELYKLEPDLVWLRLTSLYTPDLQRTPPKHCREIKCTASIPSYTMWLYMWPYPYVASAVLTCCLGLVTLAGLFYSHRKRQFRFFKHQNIPGPAPTSLFFGNVTQTLAKGPTRTVCEWTREYGQTFGYYEGPLPVLVTSDLDLLQQVLVKQFHYFHGRKLFPVQPDDRENSFLILSDGQNWKRVRTIVNPTFTTLKMRQITPLMNQCIDVLMEVFSERTEPEQPVEVYGLFSSFTLDVIATTAFGLDIDCQRKDSTFKSKCKQVMDHFGSFDLLDVLCVAFSELRGFWTWLSFFRNLNPHPFEWVKKRAGEMVELRIKDESSRRMDLMQIMLNTSVMGDRNRKSSLTDGGDRKSSLTEESSDRKRKLSPETFGATVKTALTNGLNGLRRKSVSESYGSTGDRRPSLDGASSPEPLTVKELRANIALFLVVGFDTTSALLGYLTYEMALHPDVQQKLYTEIVEELDGKENLTFEDVHKLSYLDMVVKETLRMHPIVSNEVFCRRCCVDTVELNGIQFVKDMVVKPDVISIHFNQQQWGPVDVNTFYPERHLPECNEKRHPLAFMPFGFGPRLCIGMRYALLMVKLAAVRTFRQFQICKTDNTVPLVTKEDGTIIPRAVNVLLQER